MANLNAPPQAPLIDQTGITRDWLIWFTQVWRGLGGPVRLSSYTVATVPDATVNEGALIYVSNESGGATVAFATGGQWRRVQDRAIIS